MDFDIIMDSWDKKVKEEELILEEKEGLKEFFEKSELQVSILEGQLKAACGEIKFLREEIFSTQLELISSRSEVKVLLEEIATHNTGKEEFPDLLLSSLDKLYEDKQQQLLLINGIYNSIDRSKCPSSDSISECESEEYANYTHNSCEVSETKVRTTNTEFKSIVGDNKMLRASISTVSKPSLLNLESKEMIKKEIAARKNPSSLTLELKKAYDFFSSSPLSNTRPSWTPTTPTPCSALRPSLSLHNLASKSFTEVLIPSIKPPNTHQVTPPHTASPNSPQVIWSAPNVAKNNCLGNSSERKKSQSSLSKKIAATSKNPRKVNNKSSSPSSLKNVKKTKSQSSSHSHPPPSPQSPSQPSLHRRSYTSLSNLADISEKTIFVEFKKEISV